MSATPPPATPDGASTLTRTSPQAVNVLFDTSVLVAPSVADHPHHARSLLALQRVTTGQARGFIGAHSIAESYAALTCMPEVPRLHPSEAGRLILDFIPKTWGMVTVDVAQ